MRWAVPWFQLLLLITSLFLLGKGGVYGLALLLQILFYGCVLLGYLIPDFRSLTVIKLPYFFVQVNLAVAHATLNFLAGRRMTVWTPSRR